MSIRQKQVLNQAPCTWALPPIDDTFAYLDPEGTQQARPQYGVRRDHRNMLDRTETVRSTSGSTPLRAE